jgi:hypothetical protein
LIGASEGLLRLAGEKGGTHGDISEIIIKKRFSGEIVVCDVGADDSSGYGKFKDFAGLKNEFRHHNGAEVLLVFSEAM